MAAGKPINWKDLRNNLRLATSPLRLERLQDAINAPGCHPDIWVEEPDPTPLHYIIRYAGTYNNIDDDDCTAAAQMLIEAGANVLHKVGMDPNTYTVLQTAHRYLEGKEHKYPNLFRYLNEVDANADAGAVQ